MFVYSRRRIAAPIAAEPMQRRKPVSSTQIASPIAPVASQFRIAPHISARLFA